MTNQEAIERIDYLKTKAECALLTSDKSWTWIYEDVQGTVEACKLAIDALDKQVPKKPHRNYEKLYAWWYDCGEHLGEKDFVKGVPNCCPNCGQRLDWNEVE